jgi:uncharacterized protein YndB with AHSA1/START domain
MAETTVMDTTAREITDTRVIKAPRELIWKVWTEPVHVVQWWGPNGFTNTTHSMDVRVGGEWIHTMHGADGRDYANRIRYVELIEPELLVFEHVNEPPHTTTVTFEDLGNATTRMTFRMVFETAEDKQRVVEIYKADVGLQQTLGRLEEHLAKL